MTLKFNGIVERKKKGCNCAGKSAGTNKLVAVKSFWLPSGKEITFRAGRTYDVSQSDADFLLQYNTIDAKGNTRPAFEVAK